MDASGGSSAEDDDGALDDDGDGLLFVVPAGRKSAHRGPPSRDSGRPSASSRRASSDVHDSRDRQVSSSTIVRCTLAPLAVRFDPFVVRRVLEAVEAIVSGGPQAVHPPGPLSSAVEPSTVMMPDPGHQHPVGEHTAAHQYAGSPMAGTVPGDRHEGVDAALEGALSSTPHADGGGSHTPAPVATLDIVATLPVVQVWIPVPDKGVSSDVNLQHRPLGSDAPCDPRAMQGWLCLEVTGAEARFQQATPFPMACTIATPAAPPVHTVDRHTIAPTAVEVPKDPTVRLDDVLFAAITRSV